MGAAKGRGGIGYFIGSLIFSPLVVGVVAIGVPLKPERVLPSETVQKGSAREGMLVFMALTAVVGIGFLMTYVPRGAA